VAARTALVTGGNRGIGFEVCRGLLGHGLDVILTARDPDEGRDAAKRLGHARSALRTETIDVSSAESVAACADRLREAGVHVDVLVNNAGIYPPGTVLETDPAVADETFRTNFWGAFWLCQRFVPAMKRRRYGRVVNVSSSSGSFEDGLPGPAVYSIAKAALNALTLKLAGELSSFDDIKINSACPGWVRTRMGGRGAPRSVEEGADTIVWLATLPAGGPTGGFFRDRKRIPW